MAVKTITIDLTAYELLKRRKRRGQSFSDVVKEHFGARTTGRSLLAALSDLRLEEETLDRIDEIVRERGRDIAEAPEL